MKLKHLILSSLITVCYMGMTYAQDYSQSEVLQMASTFLGNNSDAVSVNGVRVLDSDEYLHTVRAGRDTLLIFYFWRGNRHFSNHRYPILVVDKQSTTKKTARINISL